MLIILGLILILILIVVIWWLLRLTAAMAYTSGRNDPQAPADHIIITAPFISKAVTLGVTLMTMSADDKVSNAVPLGTECLSLLGSVLDLEMGDGYSLTLLKGVTSLYRGKSIPIEQWAPLFAQNIKSFEASITPCATAISAALKIAQNRKGSESKDTFLPSELESKVVTMYVAVAHLVALEKCVTVHE